jgi:tripartite-type tricarboxylate transporter receptor subunit TctC
MSLLRIAIATTHRFSLAGALLAATVFAPTPSDAQTYPTRPVKIIIPYAPGAMPDASGRLIADKLTEHFGQPFYAENRPGAGGNIGVDAAGAAEPDGHTLLLGALGTLTINPTLSQNPSAKLAELAPVSLIGSVDMIMLSAPSMKGKSLSDIVSLAKKDPGKLNFASSGYGSEHHMLIELFKLISGAQLTHIPYRGFSQGVIEVMGDQVELIFASISAAAPFIEGKKLNALAVTGSQRDRTFADVPTFAELGYPEMQMTSWVGLMAPAKTPQPTLQKLAAAMDKIVQSDAFASRIAKLGLTPMAPGPKAFAERMQSETDHWRDIIVRAKLEKVE